MPLQVTKKILLSPNKHFDRAKLRVRPRVHPMRSDDVVWGQNFICFGYFSNIHILIWQSLWIPEFNTKQTLQERLFDLSNVLEILVPWGNRRGVIKIKQGTCGDTIYKVETLASRARSDTSAAPDAAWLNYTPCTKAGERALVQRGRCKVLCHIYNLPIENILQNRNVTIVPPTRCTRTVYAIPSVTRERTPLLHYGSRRGRAEARPGRDRAEASQGRGETEPRPGRAEAGGARPAAAFLLRASIR